MSPRFFHSDSLITHARTISSRFFSKSESDLLFKRKANVSKIVRYFNFTNLLISCKLLFYNNALSHVIYDLNAIPPLSLSFLHPRRFVNSRLLPSSGCSSIFFFLFLLPNGRVKMMEGGETCIYNNGYNFLVLEALLLKLKVSTLKAPIRSPSR